MAKKKRRPLLKFPRRMQKKLIVMFTIVAGMLIGLIGRLMYIEYTSGEKYEKIVLSQQEYDSKVIPYQRGDIVDAKGDSDGNQYCSVQCDTGLFCFNER